MADVVFVDPLVIAAVGRADVDDVRVGGEGHDLGDRAVLRVGAEVLLPLAGVRVLDPLGEEDLVPLVAHLGLGPDVALQVGLVAVEVLGPLLHPFGHAGVDIDLVDVAVGLHAGVADEDVLGVQRQAGDQLRIGGAVVEGHVVRLPSVGLRQQGAPVLAFQVSDVGLDQVPAHLAGGEGLHRLDHQAVVLEEAHAQEAHVAGAQDVGLLRQGRGLPDRDDVVHPVRGGQGDHVLAIGRDGDVADQGRAGEIFGRWRRGRGGGDTGSHGQGKAHGRRQRGDRLQNAPPGYAENKGRRLVRGAALNIRTSCTD